MRENFSKAFEGYFQWISKAGRYVITHVGDGWCFANLQFEVLSRNFLMSEIIGFHPINQNTLYLLHLFYSEIEIKTVCGIVADQQSVLSLVGAKVFKLAVPCLDCVKYTDFFYYSSAKKNMTMTNI